MPRFSENYRQALSMGSTFDTLQEKRVRPIQRTPSRESNYFHNQVVLGLFKVGARVAVAMRWCPCGGCHARILCVGGGG